MSAAPLQSLDHLVVAVRDLDAAAQQIGRLLGRQASWRGVHPDAGTANVLFRVENTYLELLAPRGGGRLGAAVAGRLATAGEGLVALAFGCADAGAAAGALRARGLPVLDPQLGSGRDTASGSVRRWRSALVSPSASRGPWLFAIEHLPDSAALPLRDPDADPRAAVACLDHVVLLSPDLEASRALYADGLGLRLALDRRFEERRARILFFRVGGATLEVAGRLDAASAAGEADRFGGLAWRVPDADAARARLASVGFDVSPVRAGAKPGTRVFTLRGEPCGVPTLLLEAPPGPGVPKSASGH